MLTAFKLIVAGLAIIGTVVGLFRVHRWIRSESGFDTGPARGKRGSEKSSNNAAELEALIAAYRRDKASPDLTGTNAATGTATPVTAPSGTASTPPTPAVTTYALRKSIVTPHLKLCYLVVKTALPQHHVFCNARLVDALELHGNHPLANLRIDLIVCNKDLTPVAAVDIANTDERTSAPDREKVERLQGAGVRYLRFTPGAIPKPTEIRELILRM